MAELNRETRRYPSALKDTMRAQIVLLMLKPPRQGRHLAVGLREVLTAIRYLAPRAPPATSS